MKEVKVNTKRFYPIGRGGYDEWGYALLTSYEHEKKFSKIIKITLEDFEKTEECEKVLYKIWKKEGRRAINVLDKKTNKRWWGILEKKEARLIKENTLGRGANTYFIFTPCPLHLLYVTS